jgi:L-iditol 2-dehydrogenase
MLVAVYHNNRDVRVEEVPKPEIGPDEILLKVMASGICGTDVVEWYRLPKAPRVLGHEATGIIDEVGENVTKYKVGDRVFVSHHVPCNRCRYCRKGRAHSLRNPAHNKLLPRRLLPIHTGAKNKRGNRSLQATSKHVL